ncbi:MAG: peptidoglycan binding domain-containing protein [Anaerolineae bacterium]
MRILKIVVIGLAVLLVISVVGGALLVGAHYRDRIMPGVTVAGVDLSDHTRESARVRVAATLPPSQEQSLTLVVADRTWQLPWTEVGQRYDIESAIDAAMQAKRERPWWLSILMALDPSEVAITVPFISADPEAVEAFVARVAAEAAIPPRDASLTIKDGQAIGAPGENGRELEITAATSQVLDALSAGEARVELEPDPISPDITTPEPALSHAEALLSRPFVLVVEDPLTRGPEEDPYRAEFSAEPKRVSSWLQPVRSGDHFELRYNAEAVRQWLQEIAPLLGEERSLKIDATANHMLSVALPEGKHRATAQLEHPPRMYVVQPGDTFYDIAFNHGFPQWHLERANPDVDPSVIDVGQVITIPSIDVLFPHPLVDGKRIEIDLPTQTLRAYEDDTLVFEFRVSSGISSTPTLAGQFQILFKEEMAFAQRWSLDMPFFMAFYEEGEDFYNGIHELPITSYGTRLSPGVLGYPASYGCVIVDEGDAEALFRWAEIGTLVKVIGVAPGTPFGRQTLSDIAPPTPPETEP